MSEKLPYEEQLEQAWDSLPIPNEDLAWKDMKRRLDEDENDRILVPPPRRGCGPGAVLIGLLLLTGLWFLLRPERWFEEKDIASTQQTGTVNNKRDSSSIRNEPKSSLTIKPTGVEATGLTNGPKTLDNKIADSSMEKLSPPKQNDHQNEPGIRVNTSGPRISRNKNNDVADVKKKGIKPSKGNASDQGKSRTLMPGSKDVNSTPPKNNPDTSSNITTDPKRLDRPVDTINKAMAQPDTTTNKKQVDTTIKNQAPTKKDSTLSPKKDKEKRPLFVSAGVGVHQQIPVGGQEWTTYGSLGRKGILTDYIPSINFRLEKQDRWFLQTEFRYGAPQHTKSLIYDQVVARDTQTQVVITNSSVLKKTYYHQVPLTFNYYVVPGLSVGAGIQWNRFYNAVADETIIKSAPNTVDSLISKKIVSVRQDTAGPFAKSWTQGIFQAQYQWKRFSIGARYSFGLQPYIKFTLPNQTPQQEKNNSLQIFLRYELWRSELND